MHGLMRELSVYEGVRWIWQLLSLNCRISVFVKRVWGGEGGGAALPLHSPLPLISHASPSFTRFGF